jgi:excisionase family DNA binding protein
MAEKMLTIEEAGERLGTKRQTTYRLVWSGVLAAVNISRPGAKRPSYRIPESAIAALNPARRVQVGGAR